MSEPVRQKEGLPAAGRIIDGNVTAAALGAQLAGEVAALSSGNLRPGLATVQVGDEYTARAYERRVRRLADRLSCHYVAETLAADVEEADVLAIVGKLNADPRVSGILILRPLPAQITEADVFRTLDPLKDIEAVHPVNAGLLALGQPRFVPSTPASSYHLLDRYLEASGRDPRTFYHGRTIVVVGRSNNVGKPAILLGLARGGIVVSCDEHAFRAGRLREFTRQADVLIVAAGVPGLVRADDVRPGAIVIDVGINPVRDGGSGRVHLVGDVDFEGVRDKAEAISPVPGGVGPVTDVWLWHNTVTAAKLAAELGGYPTSAW
ncbi:MAG: bifunctional methylenetetrahydrofolate dehydrogenase/methenyltetrahydrofolate cyclohydrolase [Acidimicrobiales bacterium]|nr:bifunctional methylenetetrahydrofolate dehydrogenase/methenyltetrahydrofolate cyclohydrolase [Acidimicrobiales bacterium]